MAKYLKVPLDSPYPDGYILAGTNEQGETVYLCMHSSDKEFVWLPTRSWAFFHIDGEALKTAGNLCTIPAYNIPVDTPKLILKRDPRALVYERELERFIKYSEVIEE